MHKSGRGAWTTSGLTFSGENQARPSPFWFCWLECGHSGVPYWTMEKSNCLEAAESPDTEIWGPWHPETVTSALNRLLSSFSRVWLFVTLWTIAHQAPCPWDSPGKNIGVGCHIFLQGTFPTKGSNPYLLRLLLCRQILYCWATGETTELLTLRIFQEAVKPLFLFKLSCSPI